MQQHVDNLRRLNGELRTALGLGDLDRCQELLAERKSTLATLQSEFATATGEARQALQPVLRELAAADASLFRSFRSARDAAGDRLAGAGKARGSSPPDAEQHGDLDRRA